MRERRPSLKRKLMQFGSHRSSSTRTGSGERLADGEVPERAGVSILPRDEVEGDEIARGFQIGAQANEWDAPPRRRDLRPDRRRPTPARPRAEEASFAMSPPLANTSPTSRLGPRLRAAYPTERASAGTTPEAASGARPVSAARSAVASTPRSAEGVVPRDRLRSARSLDSRSSRAVPPNASRTEPAVSMPAPSTPALPLRIERAELSPASSVATNELANPSKLRPAPNRSGTCPRFTSPP